MFNENGHKICLFFLISMKLEQIRWKWLFQYAIGNMPIFNLVALLNVNVSITVVNKPFYQKGLIPV